LKKSKQNEVKGGKAGTARERNIEQGEEKGERNLKEEGNFPSLESSGKK